MFEFNKEIWVSASFYEWIFHIVTILNILFWSLGCFESLKVLQIKNIRGQFRRFLVSIAAFAFVSVALRVTYVMTGYYTFRSAIAVSYVCLAVAFWLTLRFANSEIRERNEQIQNIADLLIEANEKNGNN